MSDPSPHLPRLAQVVARAAHCHPGLVTPTADLFDLGLEGLSLAELITDIETTWRVTIPEDMWWPATEVRDLLRILDRLGAPVLGTGVAGAPVLPAEVPA